MSWVDDKLNKKYADEQAMQAKQPKNTNHKYIEAYYTNTEVEMTKRNFFKGAVENTCPSCGRKTLYYRADRNHIAGCPNCVLKQL